MNRNLAGTGTGLGFDDPQEESTTMTQNMTASVSLRLRTRPSGQGAVTVVTPKRFEDALGKLDTYTTFGQASQPWTRLGL